MYSIRGNGRRPRTRIAPEISQRIDFLRAFMICGVVVVHIPWATPLESATDGPYLFLSGFLTHGLFRAGVPVLSAISGFLFFSAALDRMPMLTLEKKSRTLLVPFLVWNTPLAVAVLVIHRWSLMSGADFHTLYPYVPVSLADVVFSLTNPPANVPLYFLRDLMVVMLLAPLTGLALRHAPWVGLAVVMAVFASNLDGPLLIRNTMAINFYVGGMVATMGWSPTRLDKLAWPAVAVILAWCTALIVWRLDRLWFQIASPLLFWPAASLVYRIPGFGTLFRSLARDSFFIFLTHWPVLAALIALYSKLLLPYVPYPVFWLVAAPVTVALCVFARRWLNVVAPGLGRFAFAEPEPEPPRAAPLVPAAPAS